MPMLNPDLVDTATPPIPEAVGWGRRYGGALGPLVDLSQAVPDRPPPPHLLDRLAAAAGSPEAARYGDIVGDAALREVYAAHTRTLYGGDMTAADVVVTAGCNQAFFVAAMTLARAGDAVILPAPWYFNHKMTLDMLGVAATPLPCRPEAGFVPDPDEAEALIGARTRAVVLVSPNNPTGAIYPPATIAAFAEMCRRRGVWLVLDETYRDFAGEEAPHALYDDGDWRERVVSLYSFSKAYGIPGHRLGAIAAGPAFRAEATKAMDSLQICAPRTGQIALAEAMPALADWRAGNRAAVMRRAAAFRAALEAADGWRVDALGAYFAYVRHPANADDTAVACGLAVERGVVCLPGSYFGPGQQTHLRFAFANVDEAAMAELPARLAGFAP